MKFIKLDTKLLDSSLWVDREAREVFVTALLMANPIVTDAPREELATRELRHTGLMIPPGRYGIVSAAGVGIVRRAGLDIESGMKALERLAMPDPESRTRDLDGRRLVRVDGGFLVVTFAKHYDPDETATERQRRWREKRRAERDVTPSTAVMSRLDRDVEGEGDREEEGEERSEGSVEGRTGAAPSSLAPTAKPKVTKVVAYSEAFEAFWKMTGSCHGNKGAAWKAWRVAEGQGVSSVRLAASWEAYTRSRGPVGGFTQHVSTWLNQLGWETAWQPHRPIARQGQQVKDDRTTDSLRSWALGKESQDGR